MKQIGEEILVDTPHSEERFLHAKHICADCLESIPVSLLKKGLNFKALCKVGKIMVILNLCSICERVRFVAIVKPFIKQP